MSTLIREKITPRYQGRRVTPGEYLELEEDGFKYDMIDGVLNLSPSGSPDHSSSTSNMNGNLHAYRGREKGGFRLFTELDIALPDGGDIVRPDLCVIMNERLDIVGKHVRGAPDLVVEVPSDRTEKRDLGVKAERYLKCGVREYWIINPRNRTMALWLNRGAKWEKRKGDSLESELLKGFRVKKDDVFE